MTGVASSYQSIRDRICAAATRAGRDPRDVRLLAAAKSQSVQALKDAIAAGVALVGENYVQEAHEKKRQIESAIEWHMIGHLQRNKVKAAVELFDVIETVDSAALARELDKEGKKHAKTMRIFIEVNLAGEESKTGIPKAQLSTLLEEIAKLDSLRVEGLMTVPPFREDVEEVRPYFHELRELREKVCQCGIPNIVPKELSMGMTHDFALAIEEGATIVRIGTALFGPRKN